MKRYLDKAVYHGTGSAVRVISCDFVDRMPPIRNETIHEVTCHTKLHEEFIVVLLVSESSTEVSKKAS